jgi:methyltransferase (TIGR00027 family)
MFDDGPANTALITAAARAKESEQPEPLVRDPYAKALAGEEGRRLLESYGEVFVLLETIRAKFFDDAILESVKKGKKQFVILGAGLDARPYRLSLPPDISWFEIDFGSVLEYKRRILKGETPSVAPIDVCADVSQLDPQRDLVPKGFDPGKESVWVAEGLLPYLRDEQVEGLLTLVAGASAPGSVLLISCPNKKLIESNPKTSDRYKFLASFGAQYVFSGTDEPGDLVGRHGYEADIVFIGHRRAHFGLLPMVPLETLPEGFVTEWFIIGTKR